LRDNRYLYYEAETVLLSYQASVTQEPHPYTVREAIASTRSAYNRPAREPWGPSQRCGADPEPSEPPSDAVGSNGQEQKVFTTPDDPHRLANLHLGSYVHPDGSTLRRCRSEWHCWDGWAWRQRSDEEVRCDLNGTIRAEFERLNAAVGIWKRNGSKGNRPVCRHVKGRVVSDAYQALMSAALLPATIEVPSWLGDDPPRHDAAEMLACRNGLLHVPTWNQEDAVLLPPTPRFFSPNALAFDLDADAPPPERWLKFLAELWPDDAEAVDTLQGWFGYWLLPDTSQHKILLVVGPPRSGKGTIARVLRELVGPLNCCAPTLSSLGLPFGLQPLLGKTLAVIADARLSGRSDTAVVVERLLSISGEDAQTVDRKFLEPVHGRLPVRFMILSNELPRINDASTALTNRLFVLRQQRSWLGKEDTGLTQRLLPELPGILLWALEGWSLLHMRGHFRQPRSAEIMVQELRDLSSPVAAFVRDHCEVGSGYEVTAPDLFASWKSWCEQTRRDNHGTEQVLGRDLRAAIPGLERRQRRLGGRVVGVYAGIRIREDCSQDAESRTPWV
jgi:putative DNA primase/helicase